ncbi:MAG TPA: HAD-IC family P-type ATPase, partial [Gaiellaceae bacterium]|nr:HAD-IC family P-type ATPase [Gaiellaceae bacterium]
MPPVSLPPSDPAGLSSADAARLLAEQGPNELAAGGRGAASVLLAQLRSPLLGLLVAAAAVSIGVGERVDGAIILAIVGLSVGLGFFNEFRSEQTLVALRARTGRRATVVRDGEPREIPAAELVVGDVCLLQIGDVVPADLRLARAAELSVDESALTGEDYPAEKQPGDDAFLGTVVRSGTGTGVVTATGARTKFGGVAGSLHAHQPPTAFQRGLTRFAGLLARVTAALTISIFVLNAVLGRPVLDSLLFSLAIAVGLTPQLLPAIVTVSLSTGARRLAQRAVLVKRLVAIEDLGDADVLFSDKTGTLTRGEIALRASLGLDGAPAPELVRLGLLATELTPSHGHAPLGNPLDLAIWRALEPAVAQAELETAKRLATLQFTFERRRTSVVLARDGTRRLLCKGAAEEVLARCEHVPEGVQALLDAQLEAGNRLLALAERDVEAKEHYGDDDERGLRLLGFLVFADPPKEDAAESVKRLRALGLELKVLTGDHERTAARVCEEVGLPVRGVVRGDVLTGLGDAELTEL